MADQPTNPSSVNPILAAIVAAGGAGAGRYFGNQSAQNAVPPQLSQLLQMSVDRSAYQQPLAQAQTQGLYQMLPNFAKNGIGAPGSMPAPQGQSGGGGISPLLAAGLGGLGGAALGGLGNSGGAIPFSGIINALKKLFQHGGGGSVQGNQPNAGGAMMGPSAYDPNAFMGWDNGVGGDASRNPNLLSDPGFYTDMNFPTDPSGGTGIGPGMQQFYGSGSGGSDEGYWWNGEGAP